MNRIQNGEQLAVRYLGPFGEEIDSTNLRASTVAFVAGGIAVRVCRKLCASTCMLAAKSSIVALGSEPDRS